MECIWVGEFVRDLISLGISYLGANDGREGANGWES
jgi:hypothetical protein